MWRFESTSFGQTRSAIVHSSRNPARGRKKARKSTTSMRRNITAGLRLEPGVLLHPGRVELHPEARPLGELHLPLRDPQWLLLEVREVPGVGRDHHLHEQA